jgi:hypothetical protein
MLIKGERSRCPYFLQSFSFKPKGKGERQTVNGKRHSGKRQRIPAPCKGKARQKGKWPHLLYVISRTKAKENGHINCKKGQG